MGAAIELKRDSPNRNCSCYRKCVSLASPDSPLCPSGYCPLNPEHLKKLYQQA